MNTLRRSAYGPRFTLHPSNARRIVSGILIVIATGVLVYFVFRSYSSDPYAHDPYWSYLFINPFLQAPPVLALLFAACSGAIIGLIVHAAFLRASKFSYVKAITGEHNEIVGHFLGLVGVIYAVVLAFVVATAWESYNDARSVAETEQHNVVLLFQIMAGYHDQTRAKIIRHDLQSYAKDLDFEWAAMANDERLCYFNSGDCPPDAFNAIVDTRKIVKDVVSTRVTHAQQLQDQQDAVVYEKSIDLLGGFTQARSQRRHHYDDRLLGALWWSFLIGALIVVAVSYLVGSQDPRSQRVRTMALGAMVGVMIGLVVIFEYPYTGQESATYRGENWCGAARYFAGNQPLKLQNCPSPKPVR